MVGVLAMHGAQGCEGRCEERARGVAGGRPGMGQVHAPHRLPSRHGPRVSRAAPLGPASELIDCAALGGEGGGQRGGGAGGALTQDMPCMMLATDASAAVASGAGATAGTSGAGSGSSAALASACVAETG